MNAKQSYSLNLKVEVLSINRREFIQTTLSLINDGKGEEGCLNYSLHHDIENNDAYFVKSDWSTKSELEHHISSQGFGALMGAVNFLGQNFELAVHEQSYAGGKELVKNIRTSTV